MLTRADLLDAPITVDDMAEFVRSERMSEALEHRQVMYDNGLWFGHMTEKDAVIQYAEHLMDNQAEIELCEEWFLKNRYDELRTN